MVHTWQPSPNGIRSVHASSLYLGNYVSPSKRNCPWCLEGASHRWAPQFLFRSWLVRVTGSLKRTHGTETVAGWGPGVLLRDKNTQRYPGFHQDSQHRMKWFSVIMTLWLPTVTGAVQTQGSKGPQTLEPCLRTFAL